MNLHPMTMKNSNLKRGFGKLFCIIVLCSLFAKIQCDAKQIPLKSIKSPDGDIIDCINIYDQPALNHPLLKNHTVQMSPSYYPEGLSGNNVLTNKITQLWQLKGNCPEGTIPVRRTTEKKNDLFRPESEKKTRDGSMFGQSLSKPSNFDKQEHAIVYIQGNNTYHGARAGLSVWQPRVQNTSEFSLAQIRVIGGPLHDFNYTSIEAGWQVAPDMYGDNQTRLFVSWTKDGYKNTGCYNMLCYGFVQISNYIALGAVLSPVSTFHGPQYEINLIIWKDPVQKNWWISYQNITFGYWPAALITDLANGASEIQWGGAVLNLNSDGKHTTTQMGSGHLVGEGVGGASYFRNLQVADEAGHFAPPLASDKIPTFAEEPTCYGISASKKDAIGYSFVYGGPGRNPAC